MANRAYQVGIVGSGSMAAAVAEAVNQQSMLSVAGVLTRRNLASLTRFPVSNRKLTRKIGSLARSADVVVDCSGDALWATEVAVEMIKVGVPVVTTNPGLQLISGSSLAQMGTLVQAETGAAGTEAVLAQELVEMGLVPRVYGVVSDRVKMNDEGDKLRKRWSAEIADSDGTGVQLSQALVANGMGATVVRSGMVGMAKKNYRERLAKLAARAREMDKPVVDYLVDPNLVGAVFVVAEARGRQVEDLKHLRLGAGPELMFIRPYQMGHLGVLRTIKQVLKGEGELFNNSMQPTMQVVAVAKKDLKQGEVIVVGVGGNWVRGEARVIKTMGEAVPVAMLTKTRVKRAVKIGEVVKTTDVELEPSVARSMWEETREKLKAQNAERKTDRVMKGSKLRILRNRKVGRGLMRGLVGRRKGGVYEKA